MFGAALATAMLGVTGLSQALVVRAPGFDLGPRLIAGAPSVFDGISVISLTRAGPVTIARFNRLFAPLAFSAEAAAGMEVLAGPCDEQCQKYQQQNFTAMALRGELAGKPPTCIAGFIRGMQCPNTFCLARPAGGQVNLDVAIIGTFVAYQDRCGQSPDLSVQDLASSSPPTKLAGLSGPVLSGHWLLAKSGANGASLSLIDLTSGMTALSESAPGAFSYAAQDDGSIAWVVRGAAGGYSIRWASPAAPAPHPVSSAELPVEVRIASGLIAVARPATASPQGRASPIRVYDRSGHLVATQPDPAPIEAWDFDGSALTRAEIDCAAIFVVSRNLSDPPANLPTDRCRAAVPIGRAVLRHSTITFRVRCIASASVGCSGTLHAVARLRGCRRRCSQPAGNTKFYLRAGETKLLTLSAPASLVSWVHRGPRRQILLRVAATAVRGPTQKAPASRASGVLTLQGR